MDCSRRKFSRDKATYPIIKSRNSKRSILVCEMGAAAIEFAIIAPLFFACVLTLIAYGVYLSTAHSIQQIAADAARTAIAGLSEGERERLATDYIRRTTMDQAFIKSSRMTVTVRDDAKNTNQFTVRIKYDAADLPIFNLFTFAMPSSQIERFATIRVGGV